MLSLVQVVLVDIPFSVSHSHTDIMLFPHSDCVVHSTMIGVVASFPFFTCSMRVDSLLLLVTFAISTCHFSTVILVWVGVLFTQNMVPLTAAVESVVYISKVD
jgi:hypothetical protein